MCKKVLSVVLSFMLVLVMFPTAASAAGATVSASSASGAPGDTVSIELSLSGNSGFTATKLTVSFDETVLKLAAKPSIGNVFQNTEMTPGGTLESPYGIIFENGLENVTANGTLCTLSFEILDGAAPGTYTIGVSVDSANTYDADLNPYELGASSGSVTVEGEAIHTHSLVLVEAKEATCEEDGNTAYYACDCGQWFEDAEGTTEITDKSSVVIAALGHNWGEWTVSKEASETEEGEEIRVCTRDSSHTETRPIPVIHIHHLTLESPTDATCEGNGNLTYYSCGCGKWFEDSEGTREITNKNSVVVPALGHDWGNWTVTKAATCTEEGSQKRTCKRDSNHVETRSIPVDSSAHNLTRINAVSASCETEGSIEYYVCSDCGKWFEDATGSVEITDRSTITVAPLGHAWSEWTVTKPATVDEEGIETRICSVCSETETRAIPKIHVHHLTVESATDATCEEDGHTAYYVCNGCDSWFEDAMGTVEVTDKSSVVIPALGHDWDEGKVTKEPTCKEEGVKTFTCKHYASHTKTEPIPATGEHSWSDWTVTKQATETEEGVETRICSVCGDTETRAIAKLQPTKPTSTTKTTVKGDSTGGSPTTGDNGMSAGVTFALMFASLAACCVSAYYGKRQKITYNEEN